MPYKARESYSGNKSDQRQAITQGCKACTSPNKFELVKLTANDDKDEDLLSFGDKAM